MSDEVVTYPQNTRHPAGYSPANEVQSLAQATGTSTAGTFTLTVTTQDGSADTTAAIAYNASAATVITALNLLDNVEAGSIVGAGGALPTAVTLTFEDDFRADNDPVITVDNTSNTGGTYAVTTTTEGVSGAYDVQIASGNDNIDGRTASQHRTDAAPDISGH